MPPALSPLCALLPHPDDEVFFAGLLAKAARAGAAVHLVCATRGERGPKPPGCATEAALAARRSRELEAASRVLGASPPRFVDLPDGGLARYDVDSLAEMLADFLAPIRPDTLVGFGADGGYGHSDHVALARAAPVAASMLEPAPRVLAAAFPRGLFTPIWRRLRRLGDSPLDSPIDARVTAADLGARRDDAHLVVSAAELADQKRQVASAHASQLPGGNPDNFLAPGFLDELCREEWYTLISGPPVPEPTEVGEIGPSSPLTS